MNSTLPTVAFRFDIDALEAKYPDGSYGEHAWAIIVDAVDFSSVQGQTGMFEGDSLDNEYVFCIAFQNPNQSSLDAIQASMEASSAFKAVAHSRPIITDADRARVVGLPLIHNAEIRDGEIDILVSTLLRSALAKHKHAKTESLPDSEAGSIPERLTPASNRTASLEDFTSKARLVSFLEERFGVPNVYGAYITPEELCDIVEKYHDVTKAFLSHSFSHGNEMHIHILTQTDVDTLFANSQTPQTTNLSIRLEGLTEFASHADALNFCTNSVSKRGGVDSAWNIQGKHALNFMIETGFNTEIDPSHLVNADELWEEICKRRTTLQIPVPHPPPIQEKYYAFISEKVAGPYTIEQLHSMQKSSIISTDTLCCLEGTEDWKPYLQGIA